MASEVIHRKVLCTNDFPYVVLPEGTTDEEANAMLRRLKKADEQRSGRGGHGKIHYHVHDCPVTKPKEVQPWP